jgi:acyl-CoA thioester hydrolase
MNWIEELKKFKIQTPISVRYNDLDTLKHVNNATYLVYLEEARVHYAKQVLGWNGDLNQLDMLLAHVKVDFLLPIFLNSPLVIHTRVNKIGNKSFEMEYLLVIEEIERKLAAKANTVLVYYDMRMQQTAPIPENLRNAILDFEGEDVLT